MILSNNKFMKLLPKVKLFVATITTLLIIPMVFVAQASAACPTGMDDITCAAITALFTNNTAKGPWYNQNPSQFAAKVFGGSEDEIFGERYTFAQINWIVNSIAAMLNPMAKVTNPDQFFEFLNAIQAVLSKTSLGQTPTIAEYGKLGPAGLIVGSVSALYSNPPASGYREIKYTAQRILDVGSGVTPAYAQGYGFNGLSSGGAVRTLWAASRNMAYLIMVILLVSAGFLIMFRVKINPQTVVSLQTMIPKLIITMLLVTFSFAIAGLVIDLIYVAITSFVGFMSVTGVMDSPGQIGDVVGRLTNPSYWEYIFLQGSTVIIAGILGLIVGIGATAVLSPIFGPAAPLLGAIAGIAIFLWLMITLVRIFLMLVRAYVMLILQICIGPLQIMLDLIPGQKGFGPWIRGLISNASVFVVVPIMLFIQYVLSWSLIANNALHITDFRALGGVNLQLPYVELAGGALTEWNVVTPFIIGFFILSITPKVADIIRDALKIPPFKYGTAGFNEAIAPYRGVANMGLGGARGIFESNSQASAETAKQISQATGNAFNPSAQSARRDSQMLEQIAKALKI